MEYRKLIIAEDHPLIVKGLRWMLSGISNQMEIFETDSCANLLSLVSKEEIGYCIADLNLLDGNSIDTIDNILKLLPNTRVLVYTSFPGELYAKRLFKIGIVGFLNKSAKEEEIKICLTKFLNDEFYLSQEFLPLIFQTAKKGGRTNVNPFDLLSTQELTVVEFIRQGLTTKTIAHKMGIMANTIATYKRRAFQKLEIENVIQLEPLYQFHFGQKNES